MKYETSRQGLMTGSSHMSRWGGSPRPPPSFWRGPDPPLAGHQSLLPELRIFCAYFATPFLHISPCPRIPNRKENYNQLMDVIKKIFAHKCNALRILNGGVPIANFVFGVLHFQLNVANKRESYTIQGFKLTHISTHI
jgi:hypothetical protein